jgi:hypothetical protein
MEYHVVQLKAEIATGRVLEAHWTLMHVDGPYSAYRYGVVSVPEVQADLFGTYSDITEEQAIEATKAIMGSEAQAQLETSVLAEVETYKNPTTVSGVPWTPAPPIPPGPVVDPIP